MATDKYLNLQGLTEVAEKVNKKLRIVTAMPSTPEHNDVVLYNGATSGSYSQGCIYRYELVKTYYAWDDGTDTYFTAAAAPQIGDTVYSDAAGTDSGYTVTAYDNVNDEVTINDSVYNRDTTQDTEVYSWQLKNTSVTLNGAKTEEADFYAPVNSGTAGQVLMSNGESNAPSWGSISGYSPSILETSLVFTYGVLPGVEDNALVFDLDGGS